MPTDSQQSAVMGRKIVCPECGKTFVPGHHRQRFCSVAEKDAFNDRERIRGRVMGKLLQAWRAARHTKNQAKRAIAKFALAEACALADSYNREDAAAGRLNALEYVAWMKASGYSPSADRIILPQARPCEPSSFSAQP